MSQVCENCGTLQYRRTLRGDKFIGTDCGCLHMANGRNSVNDPYSGLVLEHALDEKGQPIKVNSLRDMSKAEAQYGFIHAVTSYGENYIQPDQKSHTFESGLYEKMMDRKERVMSEAVKRGINTKYLRGS
jgi:hypothetical protein